MGINRQSLKAILFENNYKSVYGRVLLLGRSTVTISYPDLAGLFNKFDLLPPNKFLTNKITKAQTNLYNVDDIDLFKSLSPSITSIDVLDVSPYEGATVISDLNYPVSKELHCQYDFIYDSSVLDNLFNPAQAIVNIVNLLKPRGRYIGLNVCSFFPGAMVSPHPEWFFGFFAINNFSDCKVYVTEQQSNGLNRFEYPTTLYRYTPFFTPTQNYNHYEASKQTSGVHHSLIIAEKGLDAHEPKYPINIQYIGSSLTENWPLMELQYLKSARPEISATDQRLFNSVNSLQIAERIHMTDHFIPIGRDF
jgi:hypothetical protein